MAKMTKARLRGYIGRFAMRCPFLSDKMRLWLIMDIPFGLSLFDRSPLTADDLSKVRKLAEKYPMPFTTNDDDIITWFTKDRLDRPVSHSATRAEYKNRFKDSTK